MFWEVVPVLLSKNGKVILAKIIQCSTKHNTICMFHSQKLLKSLNYTSSCVLIPLILSLLNVTK